MKFTGWFLACIVGLVGAVAPVGCSSAPPVRPRSIVSTSPEKDVLHYLVEVPSSLEPRQYLEWTQENLASSKFDPSNPSHPDFPVYEVYYSFHTGAVQLATVQYRREDDERADVPLRHVRTLVYGQMAPTTKESTQ